MERRGTEPIHKGGNQEKISFVCCVSRRNRRKFPYKLKWPLQREAEHKVDVNTERLK